MDIFSFIPFPDERVLSGTTIRSFSLPKLLKMYGLTENDVIQAEQVHMNGIAVVTREHCGQKIPGVDALVTDVPGVPLIVRTADCVPVFLWDPVHNVIGMVHAGRKGTVAHIVKKSVQTMQKSFQTVPAACYAALGPHIRKCCYEIDPVTHEHYDLFQENRRQLESTGILARNIKDANICTAERLDICFSYRQEGAQTGRIYSLLSILGE